MQRKRKIRQLFKSARRFFGVLDFGLAGVGVLPEVEKFLVIFARLEFIALLLGDFSEHVEAFRVDIPINGTPYCQVSDPFIFFPGFLKIPGFVISFG